MGNLSIGHHNLQCPARLPTSNTYDVAPAVGSQENEAFPPGRTLPGSGLMFWLLKFAVIDCGPVIDTVVEALKALGAPCSRSASDNAGPSRPDGLVRKTLPGSPPRVAQNTTA